MAVEYAEGLYFYQSDIEEFLKTKAAAATMVEYMMQTMGMTMDEIDRFYVCGAFGTHISKEAGVTIGLYPDIDREKIISPGNTSLAGAEKNTASQRKKREGRRNSGKYGIHSIWIGRGFSASDDGGNGSSAYRLSEISFCYERIKKREGPHL